MALQYQSAREVRRPPASRRIHPTATTECTAESSASCPTAKAEARVLLLLAWLTVRDAFADPLPTW